MLDDFKVQTGNATSKLRMRAFVQCFAWTTGLLANLFSESANPSRAADAFANRLVRKGQLKSQVFEVQEVAINERPLCCSGLECEPDYDALAYSLERRFSGSSKPTRVFWPSLQFSRRYGRWTGADSYSCSHKLSHDVLITAVWLHFLKNSPAVALDHWVPERWLQSERRRGVWLGPIPDALIKDGEQLTAIEIGGNYPATWIRHHVERFQAAGWAWQLW